MSTLMHVPNSTIERVLADIARVLRPDGLAAIGVWGGPDIEDHSVNDRASGSPPRLFSRRSARRWRELLATIGDVEAVEEWGDDPEFMYQLAVVRRASRRYTRRSLAVSVADDRGIGRSFRQSPPDALLR